MYGIPMPVIRPDQGSFAFLYQYSRQLMRSPALDGALSSEAESERFPTSMAT